ncbi:MAG: DUF1552 domain-containing protein, partial [Fuerstiella sp.]|nr:DUF1552 domain-containing protein [Fuerstiella sp.]
VDVKGGHHQLSHHRNDEEKMDQIARIDKFLAEQFADFLTRMKSVREGDSNLLNNSMILYGSAISDANRHDHHDLPIVVAGRGGGKVSTGRVVRHPGETPLNNLLLAMAHGVGADLDELGDSTEPLNLS